jgi:hypothetical protein
MPYDIQYLKVLGKPITPVFWHMLHGYYFGACSQKLTFKQSSALQALGLTACLYCVSVCILHKSFVLLDNRQWGIGKKKVTSYV